MKLWQRIRRALLDRVRQRVTRTGFGFSIAISAIGALALFTANNSLFLILSFLLAALMVSGFLSHLSLAGLELDFTFPDHVSARRPSFARMRVKNEKSWMPSFSLHVSGDEGSAYTAGCYFPYIPPGAALEMPAEVRFHRRGRHRENSFIVRSRFPFGFAERRVRVTLRRDVIVYPALEGTPALDTVLELVEHQREQMQRGQGSEFHRLRPYEPSESVRLVDWKISAHAGSLQVRERAAPIEPPVELVLDLRATGAPTGWFDQAVDACAYLAWELSLRGARVRLRTQEFDRTLPEQTDIYTMLKYLALVEPHFTGPAIAPESEQSIAVVVTATAAPVDSGLDCDRVHVLQPDALRQSA